MAYQDEDIVFGLDSSSHVQTIVKFVNNLRCHNLNLSRSKPMVGTMDAERLGHTARLLGLGTTQTGLRPSRTCQCDGPQASTQPVEGFALLVHVLSHYCNDAFTYHRHLYTAGGVRFHKNNEYHIQRSTHRAVRTPNAGVPRLRRR